MVCDSYPYTLVVKLPSIDRIIAKFGKSIREDREEMANETVTHFFIPVKLSNANYLERWTTNDRPNASL